MLLKEIARRLLACLRTTDMVSLWTEELPNQCVSRQGGDEFILLMSELKTPGDAARVANRIIKAISRPIQLEGYELVSTTSIGIAVYPDDGTTVHQLLKNADAAMYHAKKEGRNNYQFFRDTMHESSIRRLSVETELRHALEQDQLRAIIALARSLELEVIAAGVETVEQRDSCSTSVATDSRDISMAAPCREAFEEFLATAKPTL